MNKSLIESLENIFKIGASSVIVVYEPLKDGFSSVTVSGKTNDNNNPKRKRYGHFYECPNCKRSWYLRNPPPPKKCRYCGKSSNNAEPKLKDTIDIKHPLEEFDKITVKKVFEKDVESSENKDKEELNFIEVPKNFKRDEAMRIGSFVWHDMWKTGRIVSLGRDSEDRCIIAFGKMKIEKTFLRIGCHKMYKDWISRIGNKQFYHVVYPSKDIS